MSHAYRVRLADGSVIGPLDESELRSWFEDGLIGRDTPTQVEGSARWAPLRQAVDTNGWRSATPGAGAGGRSAGGQRKGGRPSGGRGTPAPDAKGAPEEASRRTLVLGVAAAVVLGGGLGLYFWRAGEAPAPAPSAAPDRRLEAPELDLAVDLPEGWTLAAQPADVAAPAEAHWRFSERGRGLNAYLAAQPHVIGAAPGAALDQALAAFGRLAPGFTPGKREATRLGERDVQVCEGERPGASGKEWVRLVSWRQAWQDFTLVAWAPEGRRGAPQAVDALLAGVSHPGGYGARLDTALQRAAAETPHLDRATAERLMQASTAQLLEPPDLLRRSYERLGRGLGALSPAEKNELASLQGALYAALPAQDRQRLANYVAKARERQPLSAADDQAVLPLLRSAVAKLPAARRVRLQALFAKAVAAAA